MAQWTAERKETNRRRLHAKRSFKKNPLFAVQIIAERYPGYTEDMLIEDIKRRTKPKTKFKKAKARWDLRSMQLDKLVTELKFTTDEKVYNDLCHKIALTEAAHKSRKDIELLCRAERKAITYHFKWSTTERDIKSFATLANVKGITHEQLKEAQAKITNPSNLK